MTDFIGTLANCLLIGTEKIGPGWHFQNFISANLDGFVVELRQKEGYSTSRGKIFEGETHFTTDLTIKDVPRSQVDTVRDLIRDIAELLSFITCSEVYCHKEIYGEKEKWLSGNGIVQTSWKIIEIHGKATKLYLEKAWPNYRKLRQSRQLNVILDYYVLSQKPNLPIEARLVFMFVLLENLKHTYACHIGYPIFNNNFYPSGTTLAMMRRRSGRPQHKGFKTLLTEMFGNVGMNPSLTDIIDLRNEIIHSGVSRLSFDDRFQKYVSCQNLFREYFLRLLDYFGKFKLCEEDVYRTM
ncbi:MAG: hypothetical protein V1747_03555 [Candidatus Omnitrophota bacterium]